jgi:uncharacterized beta-barrel protein YwiB (DUF1934 family)
MFVFRSGRKRMNMEFIHGIHSASNVCNPCAWCQLLRQDLDGEAEMSSLGSGVEKKL